MKRLLVLVITLSLFPPATQSLAGEETVPIQLSLWNPIQIFPQDHDVCGLRFSVFHGQNLDIYGVDIGLMTRTLRNADGIAVAIIGNSAGLVIPLNDERLHNYMEEYSRPDMTSTRLFGRESVTGGRMRGIQMAGIYNCVYGDAALGLQIAGLGNFNCTAITRGIQVGCANMANGDVKGVQIGAVNMAFDTSVLHSRDRGTAGSKLAMMRGIQVGAANFCDNLFGVQIGVGNRVEGEMTGIQIATGLNSVENMSGVQMGTINAARNMRGFQLGLINWCETLYGIQIGLGNYIKDSPVSWLPLVNARF